MSRPQPSVPRQRTAADIDREDARVAADDRLVEDARCGRLSRDDPDPLVQLLAELARRGRGGWTRSGD